MRKATKSDTPYWTTMDTASKVIGRSSEWLYILYGRGALLPVFPANSRYAMGVTWNEMNELYPGLQKNTARRRIRTRLFVGYDFRSLARETGAEWFRSLDDIVRHDKWFDGTIYLSEQAFYRISVRALEFVCSRIYQYNELVKRHRPSQRFRALVLCADKRLKRARRLKKKMDILYPGAVSISPSTQVFKVTRIHENLKKTTVKCS